MANKKHEVDKTGYTVEQVQVGLWKLADAEGVLVCTLETDGVGAAVECAKAVLMHGAREWVRGKETGWIEARREVRSVMSLLCEPITDALHTIKDELEGR